MVCARCKASDRSPTGLFRPLPIPSRPWSHIEVDFVTGLPPSNGHSHSHDRGPFFYDGPLAKLPSATETANLLALHAFQLHGLPDDSDLGPPVHIWGLGVWYNMQHDVHPQSNGQTERANQDLETTLHCVTAQNPSSCSSFLTWVEYSHNSLSSAATGMTLFMTAYGYQPPLLSAQEQDVAVPSIQAHVTRCAEVWRMAREAFTVARLSPHPRSHIPTWTKGVVVLIDLPLQMESQQLAPRFVGPKWRGALCFSEWLDHAALKLNYKHAA